MDGRSTRVFRGCALGCLSLLGILLLVSLAGYLLVRQFIRRDLTVAERDMLDRFFSEPQDFPDEWAEIDSFPDDLIDAAEDIHTKWEFTYENVTSATWEEAFRAIHEIDQPGDEAWEEAESLLRKYDEYLTALSPVVSHPAYRIEVLSGRKTDRNAHYSIFLGARLSCFKSYLLARDGDWPGAFDECERALQMLRRRLASHCDCHIAALQALSVLGPCISRLAEECPNREALQGILDTMNRLDESVDISMPADAPAHDYVALLRDFARAGWDVDPTPGKPLNYYFTQVAEIWKSSKPTDAFDEYLAIPDTPVYGRMRREIWLRSNLLALLVPHEDFVSWAHVRVRIRGETAFDLARLALAARLYELEKGKAPESTQDLVPDYIPETGLSDPVSEQSYQWDPEVEKFYSLGPDGQDDDRSILYDPSNGMDSRGDVFFRHQGKKVLDNAK